jgi:hypothetical protein
MRAEMESQTLPDEPTGDGISELESLRLSRHPDFLEVAEERRNPLGIDPPRAVHQVEVDVRIHGDAGVAHASQELARLDRVSDLDGNRSRSHVTGEAELAVSVVERDEVSREDVVVPLEHLAGRPLTSKAPFAEAPRSLTWNSPGTLCTHHGISKRILPPSSRYLPAWARAERPRYSIE